jgi:hypothetical protein
MADEIEFETTEDAETKVTESENLESKIASLETKIAQLLSMVEEIKKKSETKPETKLEDEDEEEDEELAEITGMEAERKKRGVSEAEFYAFPRLKKLPIFDAAHTRNAMARFNQTQGMNPEEKATAKRKILAAAKKFDIDVGQFKELSEEEKIGEKMSEEKVEEKPEVKPEEKTEAPAEEPKKEELKFAELEKTIETLTKKIEELEKKPARISQTLTSEPSTEKKVQEFLNKVTGGEMLVYAEKKGLKWGQSE